MSPGNSCTPKSESEWAAFVGCSVATPAGNCVGSGCSSQGLTGVIATSAAVIMLRLVSGRWRRLLRSRSFLAADWMRSRVPDTYIDNGRCKCALPEPGYTVDADGAVQDRQVMSGLLPPRLTPLAWASASAAPTRVTSLSCVHSRRVPKATCTGDAVGGPGVCTCKVTLGDCYNWFVREWLQTLAVIHLST